MRVFGTCSLIVIAGLLPLVGSVAATSVPGAGSTLPAWRNGDGAPARSALEPWTDTSVLLPGTDTRTDDSEQAPALAAESPEPWHHPAPMAMRAARFATRLGTDAAGLAGARSARAPPLG